MRGASQLNALAIQPDYTKEECVADVETGSEAHPRTGL